MRGFKKPRIQEVKNGPMRNSAPEPLENTQDAYATMTGGPIIVGSPRILEFSAS